MNYKYKNPTTAAAPTYVFYPTQRFLVKAIALDYNAIAQALKELMHTYPDFRCTLTDERTDSQYVI